MREDDDGGLVIGDDLRERLLRPLLDQEIGRRHSLASEEHGPRVADDRAPADQLRRLRERLGRVDGAVDEDARRRPVPLGEDLHVAVQREQLVAAAAHELVELARRLGGHAAAEPLTGLEHELLAADALAFDDGEENAALTRGAQLRQPAEQAHSTASTKTSISPPHGSPTPHAISSVIP